jgi:hypothetical protein
MPALSKKYKINYKKRYSITKNKKLRGYKSIKVYHNRVKQPTRKRKHYIGGDIEAPVIYNIFPSGQSYQPSVTCLEKECYKKDDAGEKTTTCLNTRIVMNLFSQTLDVYEEESLYRIKRNFTDEEKTHLQDLTEKYLTNYVDSLFSRSIFSKNNVDLTPANTQKLKDLLEVIKPEYVVYLIEKSKLSDDIKQTIRASKEELNGVVDNDVIDNALAATSAPATIPAPAATSAPAPANALVTMPVDNTTAVATSDAPTAAPTDNTNASNTDVVDAAAEAEAQKQAVEAEAEKLRLEAEAEAQRQQAADAAAKKAAKKAEQAQFDAAKKAEMDQRFAQRRAESAAKKIEIDKQNAAKKAERAAAEVKRKEDSAEKKAARAAAALIKEEDREAASKEKKKQRDAAKTSKNKQKSKNGGGTRKKR